MAKNVTVDRTSEFLALVEAAAREARFSSGQSTPKQQQPGQIGSSRQSGQWDAWFEQQVSHTQRQAHALRVLCDELQRLMRTASSFADPGADIDRLAQRATSQLEQLQQHLTDCENKVQTQAHSASMKSHCRTVLAQLGREVAAQSQRFQKLMQSHAENLSKRAERERQFASANTLRHRARERVDVFGDDPDLSAFVTNYEEDPEAAPLLQRQQQQQRSQNRQASRYQQERTDMSQQVERALQRVKGMYLQLAQLVSQQDEQITSIYEDIGAAEEHADSGYREITILWRQARRHRAFLLRLFVFLLLFAVFWMLVIRR